jgi:hypothetical protein
VKIWGVISTAALLLAFGPVRGLAQQSDEGKPPRQEDAKPQHPQQREERPQEREQPREQPRAQPDNQRRAEDNARPAQDNDRRMQEQQRNAQENDRRVQEENHKRALQEQRNQQDQVRQNQKIQEQNVRSEQKAREEEQKGEQRDRDRQARNHDHNAGGRPEPQGRPMAYRGRIPEGQFHEHFGREHYFRVHRPVIIDNRPRFQYSGYWFELVDPWPTAWSYDDDVYVDYVDDQYYLYDPVHPGVGILISVVF